jgi:hypothetical protein
MEAFTVIDADGHVTESEASLKKYLPKEYQSRRLFNFTGLGSYVWR